MDNREIDRRVAREVMGRDVETKTFDGETILYESIYLPAMLANGLRLLPSYSTDMNAAMEVVETMRERGFAFDLNSEPYGCSCLFWKSLSRPRYETKQSMADLGGYALAICLAALEAVKDKNKE